MTDSKVTLTAEMLDAYETALEGSPELVHMAISPQFLRALIDAARRDEQQRAWQALFPGYDLIAIAAPSEQEARRAAYELVERELRALDIREVGIEGPQESHNRFVTAERIQGDWHDRSTLLEAVDAVRARKT